MFDSKVKEKKRKKINSLVQQRMKETDSKDEKSVRKQIMKEQRLKSKEKKNGELETIKKQLSSHNIQHIEGFPLNWTLIMKTVRESPEEFYAAGGWESLDQPKFLDLVVKMEPVQSLSCSSCHNQVRYTRN